LLRYEADLTQKATLHKKHTVLRYRSIFKIILLSQIFHFDTVTVKEPGYFY